MASGKTKLMGGKPITAEIAVEIRTAVFGGASAPPRGDWTRTPLVFGDVDGEYPYGFHCTKNATRGLMSVVQAFIIKHLLFDRRSKEKSVPIEQLLRPNEDEQQIALWTSISSILWNVGEKQKAEVVLPGDVPHIPHSHTYFQDSVTERLYMFEFGKLEDLQIFIKRYLHYFTEDPGPGALLLLYSAIFTRGIDKMLADLDAPKGANLVGPQEEGSLNVVTLLIAGRATPYLHNGVVYVGDEDHYAMPQYGILGRAQVGLLVYDGENEHLKGNSRQPGSRLKTPATPVWVTSSCGHYGVMFNSNRELLRNYHAEKRFELHYYTCAPAYISMTVNNQPQEEKGQPKQEEQEEGGEGNGKRDDMSSTPLERLIHCKWMEAKIIFHGALPTNINN